MNLYIVSRENYSYDEYISFVVVAENEDLARSYHPKGKWQEGLYPSWVAYEERYQLQVELVGKIQAEAGVVHTSFRAG